MIIIMSIITGFCPLVFLMLTSSHGPGVNVGGITQSPNPVPNDIATDYDYAIIAVGVSGKFNSNTKTNKMMYTRILWQFTNLLFISP